MDLKNKQTIIEAILEIQQNNPDKEFCKFWRNNTVSETLTYTKLLNQASDLAQGVSQILGEDRKKVVILMLEPSTQLLSAFLGIMLTGHIPSIFPTNYSRVDKNLLQKTISELIKISHVELIICNKQWKEELTKLDLSIKLHTIEELHSQRNSYKIKDFKANEIAILQHSSGTTGLKKGVALSHQSVINQVIDYAEAIKLNNTDKIISWLPLYHDMGFVACFLLPLITGTELTLIDPFDWVKDPVTLLRGITQQKSTLCWLPNFSYIFMSQRIKDQDLGGISLKSIKALINCSEPITDNAHSIFYNKFKNYGLTKTALSTCYAMAENTFSVTQTPIGELPQIITADAKTFLENFQIIPAQENCPQKTFVSSGKLLHNTQCKIVDSSGVQLPENCVGEIVIKSSYMISEYYQRPDLTEQAIKDGWYNTGDLGFFSADNIFVTGRKKDMIISAGKNIYPQDIEDIVSQVPGIHPGRTVAFGTFNESKGTEDIVLLAELEAEAINPNSIKLEILKRVASSLECTITNLEFVPSQWLIKSTSGKISRSASKQKWQDSKRS